MLSHCKLCDVADFADPELRDLIRAIFPHEVARFGPAFPDGHEYRKHWEVAMAVRAFAAGGVLSRGSEVLGVAAGGEPTIFYLTTIVGRVFATDLYLGEGGWSDQAPPMMMIDPGRFWPVAWEPRRLVVQHMNALELRYEDDSFDGVFSSSSIEHFGSSHEIRQALDEMRRVLKPGGVLSLSTEFRLCGERDFPGLHLFTHAELDELLFRNSGWEPLGELDLRLSTESRANPVDFVEGCADVDRHCEAHGGLVFHELDWSRYPHVTLRDNGDEWTSVHVAARKRS